MNSFSERLADAVLRKGPLCVGIDPRWNSLPQEVRERYSDLPAADRAPAAVLDFGLKVLELIEPNSGVVKPQAAFFELLGPPGMRVLQEILVRAKQMGFVTILDAKRGDIAGTATAYAEAAFIGATIDDEVTPIWNADSLTVNPYLGEDAVEPFVSSAKSSSRGLFILVRTSNPGAGLFQDLLSDGKPLYRHVAEAVARWNEPTIGDSGLGSIGAVVGATHPRELAELRAKFPHLWFLVPGYGAQGGSASDVRAAYLPSGLGAVVNSSRGITFPFNPCDPDWEAKIVQASAKARDELAQ